MMISPSCRDDDNNDDNDDDGHLQHADATEGMH